MKRNISITLLLGIFLTLMTIVDLAIRVKDFSYFSLKMWSFYFMSILFLFLLLREIILLLGRMEKKWSSNALLLAGCLIYLSLTAGSYGFYQYFNILPNVFTFEYMFDEFDHFFYLAASGVTIGSAIMFITLLAGLFFSARYLIRNRVIIKKRGRIDAIACGLILITIFFVLNNNIRINPGAAHPSTNALFSFSQAVRSHLMGKETGIRTLNQANRIRLERVDKQLGFNILIILNESLRAVNCGTHGYKNDTTPVQTKFIKENEGIIFSNFYAVSTKTILALPTLLTGINPVQPGTYLFQYPILSNYAKLLNNVKTFVISSHSYKWGHYLSYLNDGSWDHLYYQEISGIAREGKRGIDDKHSIAEFDDYISKVDDNFVGIVHLYGTHNPHFSYEEYRTYDEDNIIGKYDNAVLTLDYNIGRIIDTLKKRDLIDNTIIFATSDHAEALGEHGYSGHMNTFYEEEARVPGWLYIPKKLRENEQFEAMHKNALSNSDKNLSNIDIIPTVLDFMGLWEQAGVVDLKRNFLGNPITELIDPTRIVNFQNYSSITDRGMFQGVGIKYKSYKYMLHSRRGKWFEEVYDIVADPEERINVATTIDKSTLTMFRDELKKHKNSKIFYKLYLEQNK